MFISDLDLKEMDFDGAGLIHISWYGLLVRPCEYGDEISDFVKEKMTFSVQVTIRFSRTPLRIAS
jgi:hypothetical protein